MVSARQTSARGSQHIATGKRYVADVLHALKQAEAIADRAPIDRDDPVVVTCISETLFDLKVLANGAEMRARDMQKSIIEDAVDGGEELSSLVKIRDRANQARDRAEACINR